MLYTLHNFIKIEDRVDQLFTLYGREWLTIDEEIGVSVVRDDIWVDLSQQHQNEHCSRKYCRPTLEWV